MDNVTAEGDECIHLNDVLLLLSSQKLRIRINKKKTSQTGLPRKKIRIQDWRKGAGDLRPRFSKRTNKRNDVRVVSIDSS